MGIKLSKYNPSGDGLLRQRDPGADQSRPREVEEEQRIVAQLSRRKSQSTIRVASSSGRSGCFPSIDGKLARRQCASLPGDVRAAAGSLGAGQRDYWRRVIREGSLNTAADNVDGSVC